MGDSRIVIRVIGSLESNISSKGCGCAIENGRLILSVSADSSLHEIIEMMESNFLGPIRMTKEEDAGDFINPKFVFVSNNKTDAINGLSTGSSNNSCNDNCWNVELYDCSLYPPRELTREVNEFNDSSGPKSITLQSLGWFPSAKLVLVYSNDLQAKEHILFSHLPHSNHEDYQYNLPTSSTETTKTTKTTKTSTIITNKYMPRQNQHPTLKAGNSTTTSTTTTTTTSTILPSQLFQAVNQVREEELSTFHQHQQHKHNNHHNHNLQTTHTRRTEKERCQRLDAILHKLRQKHTNKNNKNDKVSKKVQQMLIKSRSDGDKKRIQQQDRFYLQICLLDDTNTQQQQNSNDCHSSSLFFCFFSRLATVGKILSTLTKMNKIPPSSQSNDKSIEFLVSFPNTSSSTSSTTTPYDQNHHKSYYRIPTTMPLYEAETNGYCHNFDSVIIRIFSNKYESNTTSILDYDQNKSIDDTQQVETNNDTNNVTTTIIENHSSTNQKINHPQQLDLGTNNQDHCQNVEEIDSIMTDSLCFTYANMKQAIQMYDAEQATNKTKTKKKTQTTTTSSVKVRQMLMKSKASGNKKIDIKDRLYLQVYMLKHINEDNNMKVILCQPMFFSKWSRLEDIANDPLIAKYYKGDDCKQQQVDILVHTQKENNQGNEEKEEDCIFRRPSTNLRLMDIEKSNYISPFGKIYVHAVTFRWNNIDTHAVGIEKP